MQTQLKDAVIVAYGRTACCKAGKGYIVEGGLFKRKLRITDKGIAAVQKYA